MNSDIPLGRRNALPGWRSGKNSRKMITLMVAAIIALGAGYMGYSRYLAANQPPAPPQTTAARTGSLVSTVTATGSVVATRQAKLAFSASGKLAELSVAVGDSVKAGQTLAKLDPQALQVKVTQAESSLRVARIKLEQLKEGATPEEIAAAKAAYASAVASYQSTTAGATESERESARIAVDQATLALTSAQAALDKLQAGATEAEMVSAQAGLDQAKASYTSAQLKLDQAKAGPTASDLAAAQASVESARASLRSAQTKLDQLKSGSSQSAIELQNQVLAVDKAALDLLAAQDRLEMWKNGETKDSGGTSNSQMLGAVQSAQAAYNIQVAKLAQLKANAPVELVAAQDALSSAQAAFNSAQTKLDTLKAGTLPADLASAQAQVESAKAAVATAQAKLDDLKEPPTEAELADAQAKVAQAKVSLLTAQTKLTDMEAGPKEAELKSAQSSLANAQASLATKTSPPKVTDLALQEESVAQAEQTLKQAQNDLAGAVLTAPFDGVVSAVAGNVGEQVSAAVVTLVDPKAMRIDVSVDETDVAKLQPGQAAQVSFDALADVRPRGKVLSVAPAGTTTQGVVSYLVSVGVEGLNRQLPAGMSASVTIETERKDNVLLVPNRAVKTQGRNRVVDVQVGEKTEARTVQVGSSNDQLTQIVSGLTEGELVIIPSTTVRSTSNPMVPGGGVGGAPQPAMKVQVR